MSSSILSLSALQFWEYCAELCVLLVSESENEDQDDDDDLKTENLQDDDSSSGLNDLKGVGWKKNRALKSFA